MVGKVNLSFEQQQSLENLQRITRQISRSNERLVTQRRINSPVDGVTEFFLAEQLGTTLDVLLRRRDEIDQGISSLQAHLVGLGGQGTRRGGLRGFLLSALDIVRTSRQITSDAGSDAERGALTNNFREIFVQFSLLLRDTGYNDVNLLTSSTARLRIRFNDDRNNYVQIQGRDLTGAYDVNNPNGLFSVGGADFINLNVLPSTSDRVQLSVLARAAAGGERFTSFSALAAEGAGVREELIGNLEEAIQGALSTLEVHELRLASNLTILQTRYQFATDFSNSLQIAHDKVVSADIQEEGVNLSALYTRNQLAVSSLSILNRVQSEVLRLLQ